MGHFPPHWVTWVKASCFNALHWGYWVRMSPFWKWNKFWQGYPELCRQEAVPTVMPGLWDNGYFKMFVPSGSPAVPSHDSTPAIPERNELSCQGKSSTFTAWKGLGDSSSSNNFRFFPGSWLNFIGAGPARPMVCPLKGEPALYSNSLCPSWGGERAGRGQLV